MIKNLSLGVLFLLNSSSVPWHILFCSLLHNLSSLALCTHCWSSVSYWDVKCSLFSWLMDTSNYKNESYSRQNYILHISTQHPTTQRLRKSSRISSILSSQHTHRACHTRFCVFIILQFTPVSMIHKKLVSPIELSVLKNIRIFFFFSSIFFFFSLLLLRLGRGDWI